MTWDTHHRRDLVLHDAMAAAEDAHRRGDGVLLPWSDIEGAEETFGSPENLLRALQMRWHTRLSGAIERELSEQPWDLPLGVVHAWRALASEMPGVRRVLDVYVDKETMQTARSKEWVLLASASGLAAMDDPEAVRIGQQVEHRARSVTVDRTVPHAPEPETWIGRLWHALAA